MVYSQHDLAMNFDLWICKFRWYKNIGLITFTADNSQSKDILKLQFF